MSAAFDEAFRQIVTAEGTRYVDDPSDRGGPTKLGVSLRAVKLRDVDRDGALDFDLDHDGDVDEWDIRLVTTDVARRLFLEEYWNACRCDELPPVLAIAVADSAYNQGPRTAVALLQRALAVFPDGIVGPVTLAAARSAGSHALNRFLAHRLDRYRKAPSVESHFRGWALRVLRLHQRLFEISVQEGI